jgi:hypothetical protein
MRSLARSVLVLCASAALGATSAKPVLLQTVDIWGMSTEGGEGKLYRATKPALAPCRIDVLLYGEMGRTGWSFTFGSRLLSATRTNYSYNRPFYMKGGGRVASTHSITMRRETNRKQLMTDFAEFKALFDPRKLAQCNSH